MQSFTKKSPGSSISSKKNIIKHTHSQPKLKNYFKPKAALYTNLAPLISPKEGLSQNATNLFSNISSNKSVRIRKTLSKNSFNLKQSGSNVLTSRKMMGMQIDKSKKFAKELNEFEKEEIKEFKEVYYAGTLDNKIQPIEDLPNAGYDNENGNYRLVKGDHIGYRYEIISYIGKGSFGVVCECYDHKHKSHVAVKLLKNKKSFHRQGAIEVSILQNLKDNDPEDKENVVKLRTYFVFRNHICMVFDLLSISLYEYMKLSNFQGLKPKLLQSFAGQIVKALVYLESLSIIHCDLKPENILITSGSCKNIQIIDFGSSCYTHQRIHSYIQSRYYRAPEIILGIPYTTAIDMWSLGCVIAELLTGSVLLPGDSEIEQFMLIVEVLGLPPTSIVSQSTKKNLFFEKDGTLKKFLFPKDSRNVEPASKSIQHDGEIWDFVKKCLVWDPEERITAKQALKHSWLQVETKNEKNKKVLKLK